MKTQVNNSKNFNIASYQKMLKDLYSDTNEGRNVDNIYGYLVRSSGYFCKSLGHLGLKDQTTPNNFVIAISWIFSLSTKLEFDVQDAFLEKYPGICPHCKEPRCVCLTTGKKFLSPNRVSPGEKNFEKIKKSSETYTLDKAAKNIRGIYTINENLWPSNRAQRHIRKIPEEVAEIHEAISNYNKAVSRYEEGEKDEREAFLSIVAGETVDVFAWIVGVWEILFPNKSLDTAFQDYYASGCPVCDADPCKCSLHSSRPTGLVDTTKINSIMEKINSMYNQLPRQSQAKYQEEVDQSKYQEEVDQLRKTYNHVVKTQNVFTASQFLEQATAIFDELSKISHEHADETKKQYDIFLSYSTLDKDQAREADKTWTEQGLEVFMAEKGIQPGALWKDNLRKALKNSKSLCILASPNSLDSDWVSSELGGAWFLELKIIPILFQCSVKDLPEMLSDYQAVNFHELANISKVLEQTN